MWYGRNMYEYEMVQIPTTLAANSKNRDVFAAEFLQELVQEYADDGWEFQRIDELTVAVPPGCLGALFGAPPQYTRYNVVSFRRPKSRIR